MSTAKSHKNELEIAISSMTIFRDFQDKPKTYFLNLLEQLTRIKRGFRPDIYFMIHSDGILQAMSKEEFVEEAKAQYRYYVRMGDVYRELRSRYSHLPNTYPLASRELYEKKAYNRRSPALMARSTRKKSNEKNRAATSASIVAAGTKRRLNNITRNNNRN